MRAGVAPAAPVPSHANAAVSPRPKRQRHRGRTGARRTPGPGGPAWAPAHQCRRALQAEPPVVRALRHEADRRSDGDVAGRAALGPRARPARAVRERPRRDLPPPRAALGQKHEFAYPMYPSRHFRVVREYHQIVFLIQYIGNRCRNLPMDAAAASIGRTETDRPLPWGRGPIRPGGGERRPRPNMGSSRPTPGPLQHTALPNRIARTSWTRLARDRAYRDDYAGSSA